jgi:hypothetical protein
MITVTYVVLHSFITSLDAHSSRSRECRKFCSAGCVLHSRRTMLVDAHHSCSFENRDGSRDRLGRKKKEETQISLQKKTFARLWSIIAGEKNEKLSVSNGNFIVNWYTHNMFYH